MTKKTKKASRASFLALLIIVFILIGALAFGGYTIVRLTKTMNNLTNEISSQQTVMDTLTDQASTADQTIANQKDSIADLESRIQQKDKTIKEYKDQVSEITSRYNELARLKGESNKGTGKKPIRYATIAVSEKTCYLTFDDGPSENTLEILKTLKKYNVKATFFVMGTGKISYVKKIHEDGHTVALHTNSHDYSSVYRSQKAYFDDLKAIAAKVKKYTGEDSKVIRFPGGSSNTVSRSYCKGLMTALSKETLNRGYVYFDWNVDSLDATGNNVPVATMINNIKRYGGRNKQDVVLMHDTDAKDTTVKALPQIIEFYIDNGYTFAPLTTSTPPVTHGINN